MASINRLKPGQVVYEIRRQRMGNTTVSCGNLYKVKIIEVNKEKGYVIASWNSNIPEKFTERDIKHWRVSEPKPKKTIFGTDSY